MCNQKNSRNKEAHGCREPWASLFFRLRFRSQRAHPATLASLPSRLKRKLEITAIGIETQQPVGPEVRAIPEIHQAEDTGLNAPQSSCRVALEQMQFLEPFENPEWEIDLDAIEDLAVEFVRQSFANQQLVDFGAPARSRLGLLQVSAAVMTDFPLHEKRNCALKSMSSDFSGNNRIITKIAGSRVMFERPEETPASQVAHGRIRRACENEMLLDCGRVAAVSHNAVCCS